MNSCVLTVLMWLTMCLELNSTMEPMLPEDVDQDLGEDILYQKDASFSAQLDLGPQPDVEVTQTTTTSTEAETTSTTTTAASSQAVQFMTSRESDPGTTPSPCELDCAAGGQCTLEGGVNRCQCPLGRSGATCDTGELPIQFRVH